MEEVQGFHYLGCQIMTDGKKSKDIKHRIAVFDQEKKLVLTNVSLEEEISQDIHLGTTTLSGYKSWGG